MRNDCNKGSVVYPRPGGVLNCGHAVVRRLVRDSVMYLAREYQVDGFCFLNAETLTHGARV